MTHIALILDGNRRWAKVHNLLPKEGHKVGMEKVEQLTEWVHELKIEEMTLYAFSIQNFKRNKLEVSYLMKLFEDLCKKIIKDPKIMEYGIKVNFLGRIHLLPETLQEQIYELIHLTQFNSKHIINVCLAYGGKEEIIDAVKGMYQGIKDGIIKIENIQNSFHYYLYSHHEPDLIIRLGKVTRTSNFMIYQTTYSEWFFLDKYWPEFTKYDLIQVIKEYKIRDRRYGK